jgi:hypothetical protein
MTFPTAPVDVCAPTEWLPCGPYVTPDDACAPCERIDFENPADLALWEKNAWYATRRVFLATGAKFTNCCEMTFHPCQQRAGQASTSTVYLSGPARTPRRYQPRCLSRAAGSTCGRARVVVRSR